MSTYYITKYSGKYTVNIVKKDKKTTNSCFIKFVIFLLTELFISVEDKLSPCKQTLLPQVQGEC